jgi:hypothetical protein
VSGNLHAPLSRFGSDAGGAGGLLHAIEGRLKGN